ncbi:MAG: hypothetical protein ACE5MI_05325 [Acidimicrobiia bacterium]
MRTLIKRLFKVALALTIVQGILLAVAAIARRYIPEWGDEESNEFQTVAILDGRELQCRAPALRGGTAIAIYGGAELDLRRAELASAGATLRIVTVFGGVSVLVPDGWNVRMKTIGIMGGAEKRTTPDDELPAAAPELAIDVTAVFGGAAVRAKALSKAA